MRKTVFFAIVAIVAFFPSMAAAIPDVQLTTEVAPEDLSAGVLAEILGDAWTQITGVAAKSGARFSGMVSGMLGLLNLAAMVYAAAMVSYIWVIEAVTTAHEGRKIGGQGFSSLWAPVRHAFAFTMTIPVLKGLSIMQCAILACLGLSINIADLAWNTAASHLVESAGGDLAKDMAVKTPEADAAGMMPAIFQDFATQRVYQKYAEASGKGKWADTFKSADTENRAEKSEQKWPVNFRGEFDPDGRIMRETDYKKGKVKLHIRIPQTMKPEGYATVTIDAPAWNCGFFSGCEKPSGSEYAFRLAASEAAIKNVLAFWETTDILAGEYLGTEMGGCNGPSGSVCGSGKETGRAMAAKAAKAAKDFAASLTNDLADILKKADSDLFPKLKEDVVKALGIQEEKSEFGWVMAGMYPFTVSTVRKKSLDALTIGIGTTYGQPHEPGEFLDDWKQSGIRNAGGFFTTYMGQDPYFATKALMKPRGSEGALDILKNALVKAFTGQEDGGDGSAGALGYVLKLAARQDPVIIAGEFGQRFIATGENLLIVGAIAKGVEVVLNFLGKIKNLFGFSDFSLGASFIIPAALAIMTLGVIFAYVLPVMPLVFWMMALFSWLFLAAEALVAAPFWVCSHAASRGDGLTSLTARKGYIMLFDIMARPTLLVTGAVFAIILSKETGTLVSQTLNLWFLNNTGLINFFTDIIFAILVVSILYYVYYKLFTTGVLYLPGRLTQWCGRASASTGLGGEEALTGQILGAASYRSVKGTVDKGYDTLGGLKGLKNIVPRSAPREIAPRS